MQTYFMFYWRHFSFEKKSDGLLLATDVAARGLDIPNIDIIIHYQIPKTSEVVLFNFSVTHLIISCRVTYPNCWPTNEWTYFCIFGSRISACEIVICNFSNRHVVLLLVLFIRSIVEFNVFWDRTRDTLSLCVFSQFSILQLALLGTLHL